jgi:hypothetical protein
MPKLSPVPLLCGHLRNLIYGTSVETEVDLIARILATREAIEYRPRTWDSTSNSSCELIGNNIIENITQNIKQNEQF